MIIAAIMAGGIGARMGNLATPKQYLTIGGKPILVHTAEKFWVHPAVEHVVVLTPPSWIGYTNDILAEHLPQGHGVQVIAGGESRSGTLRCALHYVRENFGGDDHILITHDAVRPFVTHRIISDNIAAAEAFGACDTVIPATDTIVRSEDGKLITEIPNRNSMFQGQTPQSFRCAQLRTLVESLTAQEEAALTDACKICALRGVPVALVQGETHNIKITYPYDLKVANALLGIESAGGGIPK
ncbi:MAG: 2-C-methyl-D-erythritol 4-phosphate cytidylyltransferase [Oscillospiraceae bacterium]|jgi:2-C-methyl-D-erythritol 4-phosphate cytidylyltransferase|nr:2-C-methyl-D-erythritol 4-phosphate cytidylyltransferase [Oscillospiraceae bacterium]